VIISRKLKIGAHILVVMGGLAGLSTLLAAFIIWTYSQGIAAGFRLPASAPLSLILALGLIFSIPAIIALVGGLNALKGQRWKLTLAGSICACLYFSILAIPVLIIIILSRSEFSNPTNVK